MNMGIKTDAEIIEDMLEKLKQKDLARDELLTTLTDLEYYLHQVNIPYHRGLILKLFNAPVRAPI